MDIHLLHPQGFGIRKIAGMLHISRNAVRRALRASTPPTGKRRRIKGVKLAPYTDLIDSWLRDEIKSQWTAERIFDELQDRDYNGGCTVAAARALTASEGFPGAGACILPADTLEVLEHCADRDEHATLAKYRRRRRPGSCVALRHSSRDSPNASVAERRCEQPGAI